MKGVLWGSSMEKCSARPCDPSPFNEQKERIKSVRQGWREGGRKEREEEGGKRAERSWGLGHIWYSLTFHSVDIIGVTKVLSYFNCGRHSPLDVLSLVYQSLLKRFIYKRMTSQNLFFITKYFQIHALTALENADVEAYSPLIKEDQFKDPTSVSSIVTWVSICSVSLEVFWQFTKSGLNLITMSSLLSPQSIRLIIETLELCILNADGNLKIIAHIKFVNLKFLNVWEMVDDLAYCCWNFPI